MKNMFTSVTRKLESDIDSYLDRVSSSGLVFLEGIKCYLNGNLARFEQYNEQMKKLETSADEKRREIKHQLYTYMLIPESRGDVLGLLETIDDVVDVCEKVLAQFSIEQPQIPPELTESYRELVSLSANALEELVKATRAFFKEIKLVNEYINKVHFYEHEADKVEEMIKYSAFRLPGFTEFSKRVHLRYFAEKIALVSDTAETVAERLAVYAIKRKL
ncbi:MAG: DUF47 family protein [Candidatus Cloacimonetes bacterium]|nr:DUF47 family protein [Candidatus Cloacimonadota bacterium]